MLFSHNSGEVFHYLDGFVISLALLSTSIPLYYIADTFTDDTVMLYEISNTAQSQPSVKIVVENGDYRRLRGSGKVDSERRGYIIGYRECVSNPSEVCYIFHNDVSAYIIIIIVVVFIRAGAI